MTARTAFRGQPLLLLATVLGGWLAFRTALWVPPFAVRDAIAVEVPAPRLSSRADAGVNPVEEGANLARSAAIAGFTPASRLLQRARTGRIAELAVGQPSSVRPAAARDESLAALQSPRVPGPGMARAAPLPVPLSDAGRDASSPPSSWSADGWLLLRQDSRAPLLGIQPSYGRSQAGAVLRYQLAPGSAHRPQAHLRASAALAGPRERELAAGLSTRAMPGVPVRLFAEARINDTQGGIRVRPAAYAVTELAPQALPLGLRGEAYLQAGYVGGEGATAFVDGQARIERSLARLGEVEFSAGAGVWGGAQEGAARLDVGPTASLGFRLGEARARIAADYRFRVAGDAAPADGAALTLSAGF